MPVVDGDRRAVELEEAVVQADAPVCPGEWVTDDGVWDQQRAAARSAGGERVGELVAPAAPGEILIVPLAGGAEEREPDLVDREGVVLQRAGGLLCADQLAASLGAGGQRLDDLRAGLGHVPHVTVAVALAAVGDIPGEAMVGEVGEAPLGSPKCLRRCQQLVQLAG